jgi:hypothetical protein
MVWWRLTRQQPSLLPRPNLSADEEALERDCSLEKEQSMSQQPFEIGDEVVFIPDLASTPERVIDIEWLDAPVPHWQVITIWWIGGREFRRVGDAAEFRRACT